MFGSDRNLASHRCRFKFIQQYPGSLLLLQRCGLATPNRDPLDWEDQHVILMSIVCVAMAVASTRGPIGNQVNETLVFSNPWNQGAIVKQAEDRQ